MNFKRNPHERSTSTSDDAHRGHCNQILGVAVDDESGEVMSKRLVKVTAWLALGVVVERSDKGAHSFLVEQCQSASFVGRQRAGEVRVGSGMKNEKDAEERQKKFPTIQELMKATEDRLRRQQLDNGAREASATQPFYAMMSVKEEKPSTTHEYLEWLEVLAGRRPPAADETFTVAIVLGKGVASGRISVEHASRVCSLVRALRDGLSPCLVVFASSAASRAAASCDADGKLLNESCGLDDAHAACTYFQHCCESVLGAAFPASRVVVSPTPLTTKEAVRKLIVGAILPRLKTVAAPLHVALFGSDYQLRRLDKVWRVTPRLSLLSPLAQRNATPKPRQKKKAGPAEDGKAEVDRAYETSWSFGSARYPPLLLANDAAGNFLAKMHVLVDSLVPLLINLHGVVNKEEFLAREYYDDLCDAKARLARAQAVVDSPMRPAALRALPTMATLSPSELSAHLNRADAPPLVDEALERVIRSLNDLERLLRPAASRTDSLAVDDWRRALKLLQRALADARAATDPDRPLPADQWGMLLDEARTDSSRRRSSKTQLLPTTNDDHDRLTTTAVHLNDDEGDNDDEGNGKLDPNSDYYIFHQSCFDPPHRYWSE